MKKEVIKADILIIGGGAAGCYAAILAARGSQAKIVVVDKSNIDRSGCLAAGVNALNAYIGPGHQPQDYVDYARQDAEDIVRGDLLLTMSERLNQVTADVESLGLTILKDDQGRYIQRGWRNVKINGENLKPLLAKAVRGLETVTVLEHINVTSLLAGQNRIAGAVGFGILKPVQYIFKAPVVICAAGGAAGLYQPNLGSHNRHKMWYSPFNTGAAYAMGLKAGAEMTTFEMRFVALRCKNTIAPTGTLAQGLNARQINGLGEDYESRYGLTTSQRAYGTWREAQEGRGPCRLSAKNLKPEQIRDIYKAYLNMAPGQTLQWLEENGPSQPQPGHSLDLEVEIEGTEPYVIGGHTAAGYWVDTDRQSTVRGLFAIGDAAGGCPQKYVSGAWAEAAAAVPAALYFLKNCEPIPDCNGQAQEALKEAQTFLERKKSLFEIDALEEAMQKIMDDYAGGRSSGYAYNAGQLEKAKTYIVDLSLSVDENLKAEGPRQLLKIYELKERLLVCRCLIAHLSARQETRWPGFARHSDFPDPNPQWRCYVNSRLVQGQIEIFQRPLVKEGERYVHSY